MCKKNSLQFCKFILISIIFPYLCYTTLEIVTAGRTEMRKHIIARRCYCNMLLLLVFNNAILHSLYKKES